MLKKDVNLFALSADAITRCVCSYLSIDSGPYSMATLIRAVVMQQNPSDWEACVVVRLIAFDKHAFDACCHCFCFCNHVSCTDVAHLTVAIDVSQRQCNQAILSEFERLLS